MGYDHNPDYETMLAHTSRHNIRRWLLTGAREEDAQTIKAAIKRLSDGALARGLAKMLVSDR